MPKAFFSSHFKSVSTMFLRKTVTILTGFLTLLTQHGSAQCTPPPNAVAASANTIYYAGGNCTFYDSLCQILLQVPASEAVWSCSPAKAKWAVVSPSSGGYYEFPNYSTTPQACNLNQYTQPFWKSTTIHQEPVLLNGINSSARLLYKPAQIVSVTNYNGTLVYTQNTDFSISGRTITQLSSVVSAEVVLKAGVKGNGQPNGLMNTLPVSWTMVTYIPDRSDWTDNSLFPFKGDQLPKTYHKLRNQQPVSIQALGMSITAGHNVSGFAGDPNNFSPTYPYMHGYVSLMDYALQEKFGSDITTFNSSCGGKTAAWADQYCTALVNPNNPDLVIIDMGMNDIWGTSTASFRNSILSAMAKIKAGCPNVEFILLANMLPDITGQGAPASGATTMKAFLEALKSMETSGVVCVDMTSISDSLFQRKGARHCTANALHPNDFLARCYANAITEIFDDGATPPPTVSKKYYVNTYGDNTDGKTINSAWTSLSKFNQTTFTPGDTILFEGGKSFLGNLELDVNDGNDPSKPIVISTYGNGNANIITNVNNKCGFQATNTQGIHLSNLNFTGPGIGNSAGKDGMLFFTTLNEGYLANISIKNVTVSHFGFCGIRFYSDYYPSVKSGFKDVKMDRCTVHNCRENGIVTLGYDNQQTVTYQHKNVHITHSKVYDIKGYAANNHKGSGIVLSQIEDALVEYCEVFQTGLENTACGGPGGIWAYAANNITFQYCESHHNRSGGPTGCDGFGFDFDGGVSNSTIQYCYSHDNDGPGFLLGNFWGARPWFNNTIRYNISINDSRTNNSPITLFTAPSTLWDGLNLYNNTILTNPAPQNNTTTFSSFQMTDYGTSMKNVVCANNLFLNSGGMPFVHVPATFTNLTPKFIGNLYWSQTNTPAWFYGSTQTTLEAFRNSGPFCEKINNINTGKMENPMLSGNPLSPPTLSPLANDSLPIGKISFNSPAHNTGLNLQELIGVNPGSNDFWNNTLPIGPQFDIGANELPQLTTTPHPKVTPNTTCFLSPNPADDWVSVKNPFPINSFATIADLHGQTRLSLALLPGETTKMQIDTLEPGQYWVIINATDSRSVCTLFVQQ
jgi:lysophospholipase L1-like esterase